MNATIEKNELVIRVPILPVPRPSSTGKSLTVATTGGNVQTTVTINGKPVTVGVNAYIKP